ncbi:HNH endonuclease [Loigolactobacillus bifermentans]|uniref:HNH endonuclease n=1 Tax=Loigolactobacillus bifermentans TaxID=1607 RepID=UPI003B835725
MCQYEGCNNLVDHGKYCQEHAYSRKYRQAKRKKRDVYHHDNKPYYRTERWQTVCMEVDIREHNCCQRCGRYVYGRHKHHHHIKPIKVDASLAYDPNNIMLLCNLCHPIVEHEQEAKPPKVFPSYFSPPTPNQNFRPPEG